MQQLRSLVRTLLGVTLLAWFASAGVQASTAQYWQSADSHDQEDYIREPMPPGIQVVNNELEGSVFADSRGRTLYRWPLRNLRNGATGDRKNGAPVCQNEVHKETSGLMSPYPGGLLLPDHEQRPSCAQMWPPLVAPPDAKSIGKWTIVKRLDGQAQWARDGYPLYISILDRQAGDVVGGMKVDRGGDAPVVRVPVGPLPDIPPELAVMPVTYGRLLLNHKGFSVYAWSGDTPDKSNCTGRCLEDWSPVLAPGTAQQRGDWSVVERSPGVKQWAYRQQPLYTYVQDPRTRSLIGSDLPGWHNVYTQRMVAPPSGFTVQDSRLGQVLADSGGKTIYFYNCDDDALDQLACDHPDRPQEYRLAICGNGDPKLCQQTFPYVTAVPGAYSESQLWTVVEIDPSTGHRASPGQADVLHVWAFRDRPVYTFARDLQPGDTNGDAWGEFNGHRNGFKAFWLRDDFRNNAFSR